MITISKYTIKKFDGDDSYSWAVFRKSDVKGLRSPVFHGQATPIVSGCSKREADYHKKLLDNVQEQVKAVKRFGGR